MRKSLLIAVVAILAMTAMAQASVVSFSWGTSFLQLSSTDLRAIPGGTTGSLAWYVDDLSFGILSDTIGVTEPGNSTNNSGTIQVNEIVLDKWLSKSVAVGLGFGTAIERNDSNASNSTFSNGGSQGTSVDIRGTIQLLSGKGDKINASLDFNIAQRFITVPFQETDDSGADISRLSGTVASLSVTLGL